MSTIVLWVLVIALFVAIVVQGLWLERALKRHRGYVLQYCEATSADIDKRFALEKEQRQAAVSALMAEMQRVSGATTDELTAHSRAIDELTALDIQKRLIALETTNKPVVEKPPDVSPAGTWTETVNRIENGTKGKRRPS
jgi:hypothetical protein